MNTNEFLREYRVAHPCLDFIGSDGPLLRRRPYVTMKDGFGISIQASSNHYCWPRVSFDVDYESVELGFPTADDDLIAEYAEDPDDLTHTVYGYVPVEVVDALIEKHGGIDEEKTEERYQKDKDRL